MKQNQSTNSCKCGLLHERGNGLYDLVSIDQALKVADIYRLHKYKLNAEGIPGEVNHYNVWTDIKHLLIRMRAELEDKPDAMRLDWSQKQ